MAQNKIKIARISGEFMDKNGDVTSYLCPHTGYSALEWFEYGEGKNIFDGIKFKHLLKDCDDVLNEYKKSKEEHEFEILLNYDDGFKPYVYLFVCEIPEHIWRLKETLAKANGYDDDVMGYITDFTNYEWDLEAEKEIEIPKKLLKSFDNFKWIQANYDKLQLKYMQFLVETGGDDNITQDDFNLEAANKARFIVEM